MKSSEQEILPIIGTSMGAGFYAGRTMIDGQAYALIVAPKAEGEIADQEWIGGYKDVPGALSYHDGAANTKAMAEAGSVLAQWAMDLTIGGHRDWYIPSQDELEIIYRNLKPTTKENSQWVRSGINLSAMPPTRPYAAKSPAQTQAEAFREGGEQAFEDRAYWTSTQRAEGSSFAWCQYFSGGTQVYSGKLSELRARAVRRLPI